MAPVRPKSKASKAANPRNPPTQDASVDEPFKSSKKDKRQIKHSTLLSKIEKSRKKPLKRRRPSKKLVANLDSLADALPDAAASEGQQQSAGDGISSQVNLIRQKSLKHRPGALKRKEKLDRLERDRFGKNMAQMTTGLDSNASQGGGDRSASTSGRWSALRSFISQTMEQNPEFKTGKSS